MNRENLPWLILALLLLVGGWFASQRMLVDLPPGEETIETFREWLWGTRSVDLAVQVGIIFVGALGIAALLPRGDEVRRSDKVPSGNGVLNGGTMSNGNGMLLDHSASPGDEPNVEGE